MQRYNNEASGADLMTRYDTDSPPQGQKILDFGGGLLEGGPTLLKKKFFDPSLVKGKKKISFEKGQKF